MRKVWLIACKDMKEGFGRRTVVLRVMIPVLVLPVMYGGIFGYAVRRVAANPKAAAMLSGQMSFYAAFVALLGIMLGTAIAADAIAGEKERRTIEPLMATPVSDLEIFTGKVVAGFLPSILGGYGSAVLFFVTARLLAGAQPLLIPAASNAARLILLAIPVVTAIFLAVGVMVSARSTTVTGATQVSALLTMPVFGGMVYFALRAGGWPFSWLLLVLGGAAAVAILLLLLGARALGREEIIARLD